MDALPARFGRIASLDLQGQSSAAPAFRNFDCYNFGNEGRGLPREALAGNTAEAEQWFAQAIGMAPKLPQVCTGRGQARPDRGDTAGALTAPRRPRRPSPHDGDAWKPWGDVLAKQGHGTEALAKYGEALKYAPTGRS